MQALINVRLFVGLVQDIRIFVEMVNEYVAERPTTSKEIELVERFRLPRRVDEVTWFDALPEYTEREGAWELVERPP